MRASTFLFAYDLVDEGHELVLDRVQGRAGLDGITMAAAYHHGRDVFPHSPARKVRFLEGGSVYFRPDSTRYPVGLQPLVSELIADRDVLADAVDHAGARDMTVHAWTVYCHNTGLGSRNPGVTVHNAFGDPYLSDLCPAHPDVRAYASGLTADIAARGVASIVAESLHFGLFQHGHHHERYFIEFGAVGYYLFGLCFCSHCLEAAAGRDVDGERVRGFVAAQLEGIFEGGPPLDAPDLDEGELRAMCDGELGRYLDVRQATVTSLVEDVARLAGEHGVRVEFIEPSGAMKGYATGVPTGAPAPESAWMFGSDIEALGETTDLMAVAYASDPDRIRLDLEAYTAALTGGARLTAAMRPMVPDSDSAEDLGAKLRTASDLGVARVDFYHYGFMPLVVLDRISQAMDSVR